MSAFPFRQGSILKFIAAAKNAVAINFKISTWTTFQSKEGEPMKRTRANQVKVYLSDKEKTKLDKLVKKSKLNQSEYMRKRILDKEIIVIEDIKELMKELKSVGNNLNQLARIANTENQISSLEEIQKKLSLVWEEIIKALKGVNR